MLKIINFVIVYVYFAKSAEKIQMKLIIKKVHISQCESVALLKLYSNYVIQWLIIKILKTVFDVVKNDYNDIHGKRL